MNGLAAIGVERGEAAAVEVLLVGVGAGQRKIDVVEHAGIARARLARCAGHQPFGKGRDRRRILVVEEGAMALAAVMAAWAAAGAAPVVLGSATGRFAWTGVG